MVGGYGGRVGIVAAVLCWSLSRRTVVGLGSRLCFGVVVRGVEMEGLLWETV